MSDEQNDTFTLHVIETSGTSGAHGGSGAPAEELELQSGLFSLFRHEKEVPAEKFLNSWRNTNRALTIMIGDAKQDEAQKGIRLDELEVSLSVSGEGNIGFVAAKAEAGIVLKFKRA